MEKYAWLRPDLSKFEHVQEDSGKVKLQREIGFFLGTIGDRFKADPQNCLDQLDFYYLTAKNGLDSAPLCDPWSQMYFRAIAELMANFIQTFRATNGLPPSEMINQDLKEVIEVKGCSVKG